MGYVECQIVHVLYIGCIGCQNILYDIVAASLTAPTALPRCIECQDIHGFHSGVCRVSEYTRITYWMCRVSEYTWISYWICRVSGYTRITQ